ncbi:G-protein coupled receptor 1 [Acorus calamus]|uniref:G-protein coupled receptor 1 n=1 Tax=Acorus calamus TaxID=4465 RepID=A0AAV9DMK1_ACOCL|nr:G-protein coupled receptor 1 [Acorus calamus]
MTSATAAAAAEAVVRTAAAGLTGSERRILRGVNVGASTLSLAGSAFIVLCYILFKELRKFSFKLIFFLALSNARRLTRRSEMRRVDRTSLAVTVMRSIGNDFGHFGSWCWTETARTGKVVHFITFYAPLWGAILYNGVTYFQVIRMLNNAARMAVGMSDRSFHIDSRTDMKGLFNSVAYGLNSSVRRAISERLDLYADGGLRDSEDGCRSMQIKEGNKKKAS